MPGNWGGCELGFGGQFFPRRPQDFCQVPPRKGIRNEVRVRPERPTLTRPGPAPIEILVGRNQTVFTRTGPMLNERRPV